MEAAHPELPKSSVKGRETGPKQADAHLNQQTVLLATPWNRQEIGKGCEFRGGTLQAIAGLTRDTERPQQAVQQVLSALILHRNKGSE